MTTAQLAAAVAELESLYRAIECVEVTEALARAAGELAQTHALRGYDAVHLAGGTLVDDDDLVFVTGDHALAATARSCGLAVGLTT
jgi:predicted nucleic acid-binding protein